LGCIELEKLPNPPNADEVDGAGGDFALLLLGKLRPLNASARPPNASCL